MKKKERLINLFQAFPKPQILDSSKLREFADNNFRLVEHGKEFSKGLKTVWEKEKLLVTSNFSFSHCVFTRFVQQTRKSKGLFGKWLKFSVKYKSGKDEISAHLQQPFLRKFLVLITRLLSLLLLLLYIIII